jgi:hypothetical protein
MPLNPVMAENPYGLPPLNRDEEVTPQIQMARDITRFAEQHPEADQGALSRALSAASIAVPMSEWKPAPVPLPISKKDQVRTVLDSRERQLRSLEQFASDPKNPVSQDEVQRIRDQIEAEAQRALSQSTLPSPVAMYEQLVEDESPEIYRAKHKEMLLSLPGFNEKWMASVSFDPETNEPMYPKWMEGPLESAMAKAMGVGGDEAANEAKTAAADFTLGQLKRAEPQAKDYGDDLSSFETDHNAWENKMRAHFMRFNPDAAALLPTFAEEQGFTQSGAAPAATMESASMPAQFDDEEVRQLQMRFESNSIPTAVSRSADELRNQIASGEVSPGDVVIVSTPSGAVAMKLQDNGQFRQVGRFSSRQ